MQKKNLWDDKYYSISMWKIMNFFYNIPSSKAKKTIYILDGILFFCFDKTALKKKKNKWFFFLYVFPTIFTTIHTLFVYFLCSRNQNKIWSHTQRKICLAFFVNIKMHEVLLLIIQRLKELWIKVYEFKNIVFFCCCFKLFTMYSPYRISIFTSEFQCWNGNILYTISQSFSCKIFQKHIYLTFKKL